MTSTKEFLSLGLEARSLHLRKTIVKILEHSVEDAIQELVSAFGNGRIPNAMGDIRYYNIKTMQALNLK